MSTDETHQTLNDAETFRIMRKGDRANSFWAGDKEKANPLWVNNSLFATCFFGISGYYEALSIAKEQILYKNDSVFVVGHEHRVVATISLMLIVEEHQSKEKVDKDDNQ